MSANTSAQSTNASPFDATPQTSQSKPASLTHDAIIWIVVLASVVVAAFILTSCLLCKCRKRRNKTTNRIERGYSISDGRNDFQAWNKHAQPPYGDLPPVPPQYGGYSAGVTPMAKAAFGPAGSAVMEPMIVEDAGEGNGWQTQRRKVAGGRYYSGWAGRISNRFSQQIGKAV